jgi:hypothetical protein
MNHYLGKGSSGKSKLVHLMSLVLSEYKATVPTVLIESKKPSIGGTSPEICHCINCTKQSPFVICKITWF